MSHNEDWQRLSVREGRRAVPTLGDGFSPQATHNLVHWLEGEFGYRSNRNGDKYEQLVMSVALVCDITLDPGQKYTMSLMRQLLQQVSRDDDLMLDVLDATLARCWGDSFEQLRETLLNAHSVWTVRDDGRALVRRVSPAEEQALQHAVAPADAASNELTEAWTALYGTTPNYSDAWDHAIKAMEDVLVPVVAPNNARATLGIVATELGKDLKSVEFELGPLRTLEAMLRLAWPNPDRHGGERKRAPDFEETAGVVALAVTIVQFVRTGLIRRTRA